ncbi:sigma-54 dependent transcriptional regulator [bacterium]|jgi:DNA-binding NtrC family response regulator|nr:sigma-54 dependent transcriptional regulator [bacterium]
MPDTQVNTTGARILIVDDVPANLRILSEALESQGYRIQAATDGETAIKLVAASVPELILLDVMMPGIDGYETCRRLKLLPETQHTPIIFITARTETEDVVAGFEAGGVDYLTKPFSEAEVHARVSTHLQIGRLAQALRERNQALENEILKRQKAETETVQITRQLEIVSEQQSDRWGFDGIIGQSPQLESVLKQVQILQQADKTSALITGASGTGKEMVARAIHYGGSRAKGPFVPMNCSAIPTELVESTLFGHLKGSFTGATGAKLGLFEMAHNGTLFLDEIGEMPLELQAKLLRVLESGTFTPIGATKERESNVRIVAATNIDFSQRIEDGSFREDLYYRLARFVIELPTLQERNEDIPLLAGHFIQHFSAELGFPKNVPITQEAIDQLKAHPFPGNIRELKNIIERAILESGGDIILPEHLHFIHVRQRTTTTPSIETPPPTPSPVDSEALINKRSQSTNETNLESDESRILEYVREHGMINNGDCRELLEIDRHRANYLLKKLNQYGLLAIEGSGRWAVYRTTS